MSKEALQRSQIHIFSTSKSLKTALSIIDLCNFSQPSISITILDGTNIFDAGHNFRFCHFVHFRADLPKPAIFAVIKTPVILTISNQHCKLGLVADNFHKRSHCNKNALCFGYDGTFHTEQVLIVIQLLADSRRHNYQHSCYSTYAPKSQEQISFYFINSIQCVLCGFSILSLLSMFKSCLFCFYKRIKVYIFFVSVANPINIAVAIISTTTPALPRSGKSHKLHFSAFCTAN